MKKKILLTALFAAMCAAAWFYFNHQPEETALDYGDPNAKFRYAERKNLSPYAMFGDSSVVLLTEHERYGKQFMEVFNSDKLSEVRRIEFDQRTNKVRLFDKNNALLKETTLDPELVARFLSVDPAAGEYPSISPYAYVANNPIRYTDPTGMYIELGYTGADGKSQTVRYNYGDKYEGDIEFFRNTFAQLDYLMANSPIENNIIAALAEHQEFAWKIDNTTWERMNKPIGEKMLGDGIITMGLAGSNVAVTTYYDLLGFETNTGGLQSPVPTLYHEGGHAFIKLQQHNMAKSGDYAGIEAWEQQLNGAATAAGYLNYEEQFVNETYEVPLARYMGEGVRNGDFGNKKYQTAGPLTNQPSTFVGPPNLPVGYYNRYVKH